MNHKLNVKQQLSCNCKKGRHINKDIAYETQEVRHGLKPGFDWGIVAVFKHYSSKKRKINGTESAEEQ